MLVYGKNILTEIDKNKIRKIYISSKEYINYLGKNNLKYNFVDKKVLEKMVNGNHQGIVIDIDDYEYYSLQDVEGNLVVVLDHLEDPHNFGAIIRTCECVGVKSIIIPKDRSVRITDTVVKTSAGAIEHVKIIRVNNIVNALKSLKKDGYFVYAADMIGENYQQIDYASKKVLVIGNEGKGISKLVLDNSDFVISIPMYGKINSLNASTSAGILLYGMVKK